MAKFMIMQWDWTGPFVFRIDGTEARRAPFAEDDQPAHPPRPRSIAAAAGARSGARRRRGD
jgi:hypothetical protein